MSATLLEGWGKHRCGKTMPVLFWDDFLKWIVAESSVQQCVANAVQMWS